MDELLKKLLEDQEKEMAMGYTDSEIMKRANELLNEESQRMRDDCLNEEMSALIMQCMQEEEDTYFMDITMSIDDYLVGYTGVMTMAEPSIYTINPCSEITLMPMQPCTEFTHFNGEPIEPIEPISKNVIQVLRPRYDLVMERSPIDGINVDKLMQYLNTAMDEALAPKDDKRILTSRTPGQEYITEMRVQNNQRRRNEGKRILSSRD